MGYPTDILKRAKNACKELESLNATTTNPFIRKQPLYDEMVTNALLKKKTERLFKDGYHARAVEEAFKLLDNIVKRRAGLSATELTGASLMQKAFSPKQPILRINEGVTSSEQNEQAGYMQILSGCMTGIRNPRAHDSDWEDTEQRALQLLSFANHLIERVVFAQSAEHQNPS